MPAAGSDVRVGDVMTPAPLCVNPKDDLMEVEALLIERRIGGAPVVQDGLLVGMLSRGDVGRVLILLDSLDGQVNDQLDWSMQADGFQHVDPPEFQGFRSLVDKLTVKDAMQDHVVTCLPDDRVGQVAVTMIQKRLHRLVVVENDRPVGMISALDMLKLLADGKPAVAGR